MLRMCMMTLVAVVTLSASAGDRKDLGDPAPPLQIKEWIKGEPVDLEKAAGQQIIVVEFWGTWCSPCRYSIPHLTEMQKKYKDKDVVFVGVTYKDSNPQDVAEFVKKQGDRMDYVVAFDDGTTATAYFDGWGVSRAVPTAFIVDKHGRLMWYDHPMDDDFGGVLEKVIADKFSVEDARKLMAERKEREERSKRAYEKAKEYIDLSQGDGAPEKIKAVAEEFLDLATGDASTLNHVAWFLLTSERVEKRDLEFAMRVAQAAYDACDGKNASVVDTYARALFDTGEVDEAIKYQKKAVELADNDELRKELQKTLDRYTQSRN
ncbi:MAG: redoxin family protein [Phycisphaerae bacterium]|nr:redoxin family protein [Phycisphaerae bacterium]